MRSFSFHGRTAFFRTLSSLRALSLAGAYGLLALLALGTPALAQAPYVANSSFELPTPSGTGLYAFEYDPPAAAQSGTPGALWTFSGDSGIQAPGSAWFGGAYNGSQSAFLQTNPPTSPGVISQSVFFAASGTYTLSFMGAQRTEVQWEQLPHQQQAVQVSVDGTSVGGLLTPGSASYTTLTSAPFTVSAGWHTIALAATDSTHGDQTVLVDQVTISEANAPAALLSINTGNTGTNSSVGAFSGDALFSGGTPYSTGSSIDTSGLSAPAPESVYQTERYGNTFGYALTNFIPGGTYIVRLHLAEIYWGSIVGGGVGSRLFSLNINSASVLSNFDIFATAGGANRAITQDFLVTADSGGNIGLNFSTTADNAKVDGIEVFQPANFLLAATPNPVYILPGGQGSATVTETPQNNFAGMVALTASSTTTGITAALQTQSVSGSSPQTDAVTVTVGTSVAPGTYQVTVTGKYGTPGQLGYQAVPLTLNVIVPSTSISVRRTGAVKPNPNIPNQTLPADYGSSATVAAGGIASSEHQADVKIAVLLPGGGAAPAGITVPSPPTITGSLGVSKNAAIVIPNNVTDADGCVYGTYTSSDMVTSTRPGVTLSVTAITLQGSGSGQSASIVQRWDDDNVWNTDDYFDYDVNTNEADFYPAFDDGTNHVAITGHSLSFEITDIDVYVWNDQDYDYDYYQGVTPSQLPSFSSLAWFPSAPINDSGNGTYTSYLHVHYDPYNVVDNVYYIPSDNGTNFSY